MRLLTYLNLTDGFVTRPYPRSQAAIASAWASLAIIAVAKESLREAE